MRLRRYDCKAVRDMLPLHVGGDLATRHVAAVDEHLHTCLNCFRDFRELATMRGRLGVLADESLPEGILDGFTEEVMARIAVGEEGPPALPPGRTAVAVWPRLAAAAVLLVAVTLGTRHLLQSDVGSMDPPGTAPLAATGTPVSGTPVAETAAGDRVAKGSGVQPAASAPGAGERLLPGWPAPSAAPASRGGFQNGLMKTASQGGHNNTRTEGGWGSAGWKQGARKGRRQLGVLAWPPAAHQALPGESVRDLGEALREVQLDMGGRVFLIRPPSLAPMDLVDRAPRPRDSSGPWSDVPTATGDEP